MMTDLLAQLKRHAVAKREKARLLRAEITRLQAEANSPAGYGSLPGGGDVLQQQANVLGQQLALVEVQAVRADEGIWYEDNYDPGTLDKTIAEQELYKECQRAGLVQYAGDTAPVPVT